MPTARPIIVIMLVTVKVRSMACPTRAVSPRATMIATTPSTTGRKAAASAPKTIASTTSATPMPIVSPVFMVPSASLVVSWLKEASPV